MKGTKKEAAASSRKRRFTQDDFQLFLLSLPTTIWYILFCYLPMFGLIIAFIYCAGLKKKMKSAKIAREASAYIAPQGAWMQDQQDMFTHATVTRQHIERDSGSRSGGGGTSVNSGGFSHSSGKF